MMTFLRKSRLRLALAGILLLASHLGYAGSNSAALAEGKAFATSMLPNSKSNMVPAAANPSALLPENSPTNSPLYTTNQPGSSGYTSGSDMVTQGTTAIQKCQNYTPSGNAIADQECEGVNFLANNPVQVNFVIATDDPTRTAFDTAAASAINTDSPGQQCVTRTINIPGVYATDTCDLSQLMNPITCNKVLVPSCAWVRYQYPDPPLPDPMPDPPPPPPEPQYYWLFECSGSWNDGCFRERAALATE